MLILCICCQDPVTKTLTTKGGTINSLLKHSLMVGGIVSSIGLASIGSTTLVSAATDTSGSTIVDKIATKFKLNKDEVQKVFDENHQEREADHQAKLKEKLDQAVKDKKISQEQEDKLIAKFKEMHTQRESDKESNKDLTEDERHQLMETKRTEFQKWLTDNNIPEDILPGPGGHGFGHGPGKRGAF